MDMTPQEAKVKHIEACKRAQQCVDNDPHKPTKRMLIEVVMQAHFAYLMELAESKE